MYSFEKLEVWQKARMFVRKIYKDTDGFPKEEQFGLTQHIRKTSVSILSNIAEGCSRFSKYSLSFIVYRSIIHIDFKRFVQISLGSLYETVSQLFIALDNGYLTKDVFNELSNESEDIAKMLSKLSKSQE